MEIYNVQPAVVDIIITKGDTFKVSFQVKMNAVSYSLTGKILDMKVKKIDIGGAVVKTLSSAGALPAIVITTDSFAINTTGFTEPDNLKYDVQVTDGTDILTIQKGRIIVEEEITS